MLFLIVALVHFLICSAFAADIRAINLLDDSCINTANDDEAADIISIREDDLEDAALMRRALIGECDQWGQEDDKILIEVPITHSLTHSRTHSHIPQIILLIFDVCVCCV